MLNFYHDVREAKQSKEFDILRRFTRKGKILACESAQMVENPYRIKYLDWQYMHIINAVQNYLTRYLDSPRYVNMSYVAFELCIRAMMKKKYIVKENGKSLQAAKRKRDGDLSGGTIDAVNSKTAIHP